MDAKLHTLPLVSNSAALALAQASAYQRRISTLASAAMAAAAAKAASGDLQALKVIPPATQAIAEAGAHVAQVGALAPTLPGLFA